MGARTPASTRRAWRRCGQGTHPSASARRAWRRRGQGTHHSASAPPSAEHCRGTRRRRYCPGGRRGQRFPAAVRRVVGRSGWADACRAGAARVHAVRPPLPAGRGARGAVACGGTAPRRAPSDGAGHGRRAPPPPHRAAARPGAARAGRRPARRRHGGGHRRRLAEHHLPQRGAGGPQRARPPATGADRRRRARHPRPGPRPRRRVRAARRHPPRAAAVRSIATPRTPGRTGRDTPGGAGSVCSRRSPARHCCCARRP